MQLFTPLKIGRITLKNRLVRSATGENAAVKDVGSPTDAMAKFYHDLASGGIGLIITGYTSVSYEGRCSPTMTAFYSDDFIPAFKKLTDACHAYQVPVVCQLNHGGRQVNPDGKGIRPLAPSAVLVDGAKFTPEELTVSDIKRIIKDFGKTARRCKQAGFDGVQIHSAHGYLISQFCSPLTNHRTDYWGGTPLKRRNFLRAVYNEIRDNVGDGYPILVKQNVSDFHPDGLNEKDAALICRMLDEMGIAAIELSGGIGETIPIAFRAEEILKKREVVFFEKQARKIMDTISCPLILTGGIRSAETSERLIDEKICDAIGMCRPLIREPSLPIKWMQGLTEKAECTSCRACKADEDRCNYCALT